MTDSQDELPDDIRQKIETGTLTGRDLLTAVDDPNFWLKMNSYFENGGASHIPKEEQQHIVGLLCQLNSDLLPSGYNNLQRIRHPMSPEVEERVLNALDKIADRLRDTPPGNRPSSQIGLNFQAAASGEIQPRPELRATSSQPVLTPKSP